MSNHHTPPPLCTYPRLHRYAAGGLLCVSVSDLATPVRTLLVDMATAGKAAVVATLAAPPPPPPEAEVAFDLRDFAAETLRLPASDGELIPVSIVRYSRTNGGLDHGINRN